MKAKIIAIIMLISVALIGCDSTEIPAEMYVDLADSYYTNTPETSINIQDLSKQISLLGGENPYPEQTIAISLNELAYTDRWCDFEFSTSQEPVDIHLYDLKYPIEESNINEGTKYYITVRNGSLLGLPVSTQPVQETSEVQEEITDTQNTPALSQDKSITQSDTQENEESTDKTTENIEPVAQNKYVIWCTIDRIEMTINETEIQAETEQQTELQTEQTTNQVEPVAQAQTETQQQAQQQTQEAIPTEYTKHLVDDTKHYKVFIGSITYVEECPVDFINQTQGEPIEIIEPMNAEELRAYVIQEEKVKQEKLLAEEQRRKQEEHRQRLNNFSKQELATYIRNKEIDTTKLQTSPNSYFIINNGNIQGISEQGLNQTELVIGQYNIPVDSKFWEQLKQGNKIKRLVFIGDYYTETKNYKQETRNEKVIRESKGEPAPYDLIKTYGLMVPTDALKGCNSIEEVYLPDGIDSIGTSAFANCTNLRYIRMPEHVKTISDSILSNTKITDLIMPYYIETSYSTTSLLDCKELVNLVFTSHSSNSVGVLDEKQYIFKGCDKLERVAIDLSETLGKWTVTYGESWFKSIILITN